MGRWCLGAVLFVGGCSSFASFDASSATTDDGGASSTGDASGTTASTSSGFSGGGTMEASGAPADASGGKDSEPEPTDAAESSKGTSGAMDSTGPDEGSTGGSESTGPTVVTCEDLVLDETPPMTCSETAMDGASLSVFNDCLGLTVEVYWVDYNCSELYYGFADPGSEFTIGSYETHAWRVRNAATGELMREIPPLEGDTSVSILMR